MRTLHPVTIQERFVGSGVYNMHRDGQPLNATESWTIHEKEPGVWFTRVDIDYRAVDGSSRLMEILLLPAQPRAIERITEVIQTPEHTERREYLFDDDSVSVIYGETRDVRDFPLESGYVVMISALVLMGFAALRLSKHPAMTVTGFDQRSHSITLINPYRVASAGTESISVGQRTVRVQRLVLTHEQAAPQSILIDDHGIGLRFEGARDSVISNYAFRVQA